MSASGGGGSYLYLLVSLDTLFERRYVQMMSLAEAMRIEEETGREGGCRYCIDNRPNKTGLYDTRIVDTHYLAANVRLYVNNAEKQE